MDAPPDADAPGTAGASVTSLPRQISWDHGDGETAERGGAVAVRVFSASWPLVGEEADAGPVVGAGGRRSMIAGTLSWNRSLLW
jgi:hypothetical protein